MDLGPRILNYASPDTPARPGRLGMAAPSRVSFDSAGIHFDGPPGNAPEIQWAALKAVIVETTADGPLAEDVFVVLLSDNGGCVIPSNAAGMPELMDRLMQLPGFDHQALIRAMSSAENHTFVCWRREKAG